MTEKVYIVLTGYDIREIEGVFSSDKTAQEFIDAHKEYGIALDEVEVQEEPVDDALEVVQRLRDGYHLYKFVLDPDTKEIEARRGGPSGIRPSTNKRWYKLAGLNAYTTNVVARTDDEARSLAPFFGEKE